jgi:hypothetical protein
MSIFILNSNIQLHPCMEFIQLMQAQTEPGRRLFWVKCPHGHWSRRSYWRSPWAVTGPRCVEDGPTRSRASCSTMSTSTHIHMVAVRHSWTVDSNTNVLERQHQGNCIRVLWTWDVSIYLTVSRCSLFFRMFRFCCTLVVPCWCVIHTAVWSPTAGHIRLNDHERVSFEHPSYTAGHITLSVDKITDLVQNVRQRKLE